MKSDSLEEKPSEVPKVILEGCRRWADDGKRAFFKGPKATVLMLTHPDWPAVLLWSQGFPHPTASGRAAQAVLVAVHERRYWRVLGKLFALGFLDIGERLLAFAVRSTASPIAKPPAYTLMKVGRLLLTARAYEQLLAPHVADIQHEYFQALHEGKRGYALWIEVRGYLHAFAMIGSSVRNGVRGLLRMLGLWPEDF